MEDSMSAMADDLVHYHTQLARQHATAVQQAGQANDETAIRQWFEDFPVPVYYVDLHGRFQWGNKAAEEVCGYRREEVVGLPYYKTRLLTLQDLLKVAKLLAESLLKLHVGPTEFTVVRKDGTYRYVDMSAFLTQLGKQKVILCMAVDVTQRKVQQFFSEASTGTAQR